MSYQISQEQIDKWRNDRWKKDKVTEILKKDGFCFKPDSRSGTIYFTENGNLCEIYVEMSGVREYDILIFFDNLEWSLPVKQKLSDSEAGILKDNLRKWLEKNNIKADL